MEIVTKFHKGQLVFFFKKDRLLCGRVQGYKIEFNGDDTYKYVLIRWGCEDYEIKEWCVFGSYDEIMHYIKKIECRYQAYLPVN